MSITQQAGDFRIKASDPSPVWIEIHHIERYQSGDATKCIVHGLRVSDLHDLRYCIDRVLAQLG